MLHATPAPTYAAILCDTLLLCVQCTCHGLSIDVSAPKKQILHHPTVVGQSGYGNAMTAYHPAGPKAVGVQTGPNSGRDGAIGSAGAAASGSALPTPRGVGSGSAIIGPERSKSCLQACLRKRAL